VRVDRLGGQAVVAAEGVEDRAQVAPGRRIVPGVGGDLLQVAVDLDAALLESREGTLAGHPEVGPDTDQQDVGELGVHVGQ
jgi:hypothetical protein